VRAAIEVEREFEGSKFSQTISLSAGEAGNRVEFSNVIDWHTKRANLKATFPLSAANRLATYNWDVGTIQRPNAAERQFEVASHQWIDLTDANAGYGVTILTDCKNGSDKPDDRTLRLTLVRTPGTRGGFPDQGTQDQGRHEIRYGLAGHAGSWQGSDWQAYRLNQPLIAFTSPAHSGPLGKSLSLLQVSTDRVRVMALKKAELSDELIVRLVEMDGRPAPAVHLTFPAAITAAREVNGQEQPVGPATITGGDLITSLAPYQLRTFALKLVRPRAKLRELLSGSLRLDYDLPMAARLGRPSDGSFEWSLNSQGSPQGKALPAELLPPEINFHGIRFALARGGQANAVVSQGQTIKLPEGIYNRVYLLAAAMNGDQKATFRIGDRTTELVIQDWTGFIGQWDNRVWKPSATDPYAEMVTVNPGFIKRSEIAWFSSQRRAADGSAEAYAYSYLFAYPLEVPAGARTLVLPANERIRILAISVAQEPWVVTPAQPLYDTLDRDQR
jgi:alpha-mannosidase